MENNKKGKLKKSIKPKIKKENGLALTYDKKALYERFPHLIDEITGKKKVVKIESVEGSLNSLNLNSGKNHPRELVNPGAIDFIRRCKTIEEAFNILDYLLKRKEISKSNYKSFKSHIQQEVSLKSFIDKHGGFKSPGYYEKKYRDLIREKPNQNRKED